MLTLTTDFGSSEYVAQMKGAIYRVDAAARIVDVTHNVAPQNVLEGAYILATTVPHFPDGTVHVGVVDPGVGGPRRALAVRCRRGWLVGPDNGLLWPAAEVLGVETVRELTNDAYFHKPVSPTFHGRDIFAPVAALLARDGTEVFEEVGPTVAQPNRFRLTEGAGRHGDAWRGVVLHVDRFGNVVTNLEASVLDALPWDRAVALRVETGRPWRLVRAETYAEAGPGHLVALGSSSGFLELAMNEASAARQLEARPGTAIELGPAA